MNIGWPNPSFKHSALTEWIIASSSNILSILFTTTKVLHTASLRNHFAKCSSTAVTPSCASIKNNIKLDLQIASFVKNNISSSNDIDVSSNPAVSTILNDRSDNEPIDSRKSRVVPGLSFTIATRLPTKRLNKRDLPTFGLPTNVIVFNKCSSS